VEEGGAGGGTKKALVSVDNLQQTAPLRIEVEPGSATSWGRAPEHSYLVRLCRGERAVVLAAGMTRAGAEHLAGHARELLGPAVVDPTGASEALVTGR
jgi:hypothetical protein